MGEIVDAVQRLEGASLDIAAEKRRELLELFPEARSEGGKVDFERLRLALGDAVETGKERYGLTWPGKAECFRTIQAPSMATLLPLPEKSLNFETTENVIIEGDNLEVLKLLQKSYLGKIKMIYIDPPYNTGNDFIYPDNYSESLQTYLEYTGQADAEGRKFGTNSDTEGRFHSKWLNMMYPRLYLARNLLREDGFVAASIDDSEVHNLKLLMNDVFGEENFVAQIAVVNNLKGRNDREHIATAHEYLLVYAMGDFDSFGLPLSEQQIKEYSETDDAGRAFQWRDLRRRGGADRREDRPNLFFPIFVEPTTGAVSTEQSERFSLPIFPVKSDGSDGRWRWGKAKVKQNIRDIQAFQVENKEKWNVSYRVYLESDGQIRSAKPKSVWLGPEFSTDSATKGFRALVPEVQAALTPKPVGLLSTLVRFGAEDGDTVLDFFAGTGTTAEAVLTVNAEDGGDRKFVLVQLPERFAHEGFPAISDVTQARVRAVIRRMTEEHESSLPLNGSILNPGFRFFRLAQSNVREWDALMQQGEQALVRQMQLGVEHLNEDRSDLDILYEVLLKSGYPLSATVDTVEIEGKNVYSVSGGAFLICLARNLTLELIRAITAKAPERVLLLDEGFAGNDQLKANAVQTFKTKNIVFRTL